MATDTPTPDDTTSADQRWQEKQAREKLHSELSEMSPRDKFINGVRTGLTPRSARVGRSTFKGW